jgi:hypothetical protein
VNCFPGSIKKVSPALRAIKRPRTTFKEQLSNVFC